MWLNGNPLTEQDIRNIKRSNISVYTDQGWI
jgi:hypothetical protein